MQLKEPISVILHASPAAALITVVANVGDDKAINAPMGMREASFMNTLP